MLKFLRELRVLGAGFGYEWRGGKPHRTGVFVGRFYWQWREAK